MQVRKPSTKRCHFDHLFVEGLRTCMPADARYYMLCFSDLEPGDWGPRRIRQDEIRLNFVDGWLVEAIEPSRIEITIDPGSARAWLASIARICPIRTSSCQRPRARDLRRGP